MVRSLLLASVSLAAMVSLPARADCVADPATLTCAADATGPFTESRDGVIVSIEPGVTVTAPNNTFTLSGDDIVLDNLGTLNSTSAANNTRTVNVSGGGALVINDGAINGSDRGIEVTGGPGFLTVINEADGTIQTRRQAIRSLEGFGAATLFNDGLIESTNGRAAQLRSPGSSVFNTGVMLGGEEVIEGREDFTVINDGLIAIRGLSWDAETRTWSDSGARQDEDGVQFASGQLVNRGVILSTDDGVDIDEGLVHNTATGVIISAAPDSTRDSGAVDVDARFEPSTGAADFRPAGPLEIVNEGYMEGPRGIVTDLASTSAITIRNSGTIVGRSGIAIDLAPGQGDTLIELFGGGQIFGDILFGNGTNGTNTLVLGPFDDGAGIFSKVGARDGGAFDVVFGAGFTLSDILAFRLVAELFEMNLRAGSGSFRFNALGARNFTLEGQTFARADFAGFLRDSGVAPIPLPAAGWMLVAALGALAAVRRRAA